MIVAVRSRLAIIYLISVLGLLLLNLLLASRSAGQARQVGSAVQQQELCPGEPMEVQLTGERRSQSVPEAVINGEPWGGTYWEAGARSYWHCHTSGQLLVVWEGEGRMQRRGERIRILATGNSLFAPPGEEHWHGSAPDQGALYVGVVVQPGPTLWMEEVREDDYLGNDIGINSRNEFLRTGVREQP